MRFIEHQRAHSGRFERFHQRANLTVLLEMGERLIRRNRQQARLGKIGGEPIGRLRFVPEEIQESANPLVTNGDRRRKDQRRFADAPQRFQANDRFSGTGRGDEMKVIVVEMRIEFRQYARLIRSPGVAKLHTAWKGPGRINRHAAVKV